MYGIVRFFTFIDKKSFLSLYSVIEEAKHYFEFRTLFSAERVIYYF